MGRHSTPGDEAVDDEVDEPADAGLTLLTGATGDAEGARGRHARDDAAAAVDTATAANETAANESATAVIGAPDLQVAEPTAPTGPIVPVDDEAPSDDAPRKQESSTQADLRILREDAGVRWLVLGAVVVAFGIYTLVMLAFGKLADYAYWVWIPIVLSGVLIGAVLDWAHRQAKRAQRAG